jgi:hypothetical protein
MGATRYSFRQPYGVASYAMTVPMIIAFNVNAAKRGTRLKK